MKKKWTKTASHRAQIACHYNGFFCGQTASSPAPSVLMYAVAGSYVYERIFQLKWRQLNLPNCAYHWYSSHTGIQVFHFYFSAHAYPCGHANIS